MDNLVNQAAVGVQQSVPQTQQQVQTQVVTNAPQANVSGVVTQAQIPQVGFTQEQVNSIVSNRVNPLNTKIQDLTAQLEQAQQLSQSYLNELTGFKNRDAATKAGVPSQFVDFAVFEASKLAVNGKSFEDAIKEYVSANGQLFGIPNKDAQANAPTSPVGVNATQASANQSQSNPAQQTVVNTNVQQPVGVANQNVQYGTTGIVTAGNPANTNAVESQVDAFLKQRGLIK